MPAVVNLVQARLEKTPAAVRRLLPQLWYRGPSANQQIYLTFDDGPHPVYTPPILEVLDEYEVNATFFLIGRRVQRYPQLAARIAERHTLGNHTWNHVRLRWMSSHSLAEQIEPARELLERFISSPVRLLRPPYGVLGPGLVRYARRQGHQIVLWDVLPWDFAANRSAADIAHCMVRHTRAGSIVVLHDGHPCSTKTAVALRSGIPKLLDQGYEFAALPGEATTDW